jgi:hypothetical protein
MSNNDLLVMYRINELEQPLSVRFAGDEHWWELHDVDVETGLLRINVMGKLEARHFGEVMELQDLNGVIYDSDYFYNDNETTVLRY